MPDATAPAAQKTTTTTTTTRTKEGDDEFGRREIYDDDAYTKNDYCFLSKSGKKRIWEKNQKETKKYMC